MIENEILIINLADFSFIYNHVFIVPEIYIQVPWAQTLEILAVNRVSTSDSLYNRVGLCYLQSIGLYMYLKKSLTSIRGMYRMLIPAYI